MVILGGKLTQSESKSKPICGRIPILDPLSLIGDFLQAEGIPLFAFEVLKGVVRAERLKTPSDYIHEAGPKFRNSYLLPFFAPEGAG